jgi:hypothetical protein
VNLSELAKPAGDIAAASTVIGTILQLLPPIAALFAICWYVIGGYEKVTGKPFSDSALAKRIRGDKQ